ncbi:MAG: hypothetical protein OXE80_08405 [Gammaproteobacteria bacterium]|nr:hypothetical protein [Gammaproteobacteria bacterium]MCY4295822.1 hypothetical protein [Gammaproteobacteria bacterium]
MLLLHPAPSRLRWLLALLIHGLALLAVLHSGAPLWLKPVLAAVAFASLWREYLTWRGKKDAVALRLGPGSVSLRMDAKFDDGLGGGFEAVAPPRVLHCSQWLIVLEFSRPGFGLGLKSGLGSALRPGLKSKRKPGPKLGLGRLRLCLFPDSLDRDDLRRLRRWLRYDSA